MGRTGARAVFSPFACEQCGGLYSLTARSPAFIDHDLEIVVQLINVLFKILS